MKLNKKEVEIIPSEMLETLVTLNIAVVKNGKYVYAPEFERSVDDIQKNPPSRWKQVTQAKKVASLLINPSLKFVPKTKRDIGNLITSYICLIRHITRLKLEIPKFLLPSLAFSVWYLNDHEPIVGVVE